MEQLLPVEVASGLVSFPVFLVTNSDRAESPQCDSPGVGGPDRTGEEHLPREHMRSTPTLRRKVEHITPFATPIQNDKYILKNDKSEIS